MEAQQRGEIRDYTKQTTNYVWNRNFVLGQGTIGCVYYGQNKSTLEPVAVKILTAAGRGRSMELSLREIKIFGMLKHENIVKLLGVEDQLFPATGQSNGKKALIMEYCSGGSLATTIHKPENHYGLPESDFLLVWEHLTNAMKYLRDLTISHRDIKPGNILIYIGTNGRKIYKLADFDTSRVLEDGEIFPSLVGTLPYLNPQMYHVAVQQLPGENCSTSVDLWSIGVTLYETATGKLPFRPHNWKDQNIMGEILGQKPSGTISGVQQGPNGPIVYSTTFPTTCHLSKGLKDVLTPILAALCETNKEKHWNYQKYFDESYSILKRKRVHIFNVNSISSFCVYLDGDEGQEPVYRNLVTAISNQTNFLPEEQLLFYKNSSLFSFLDSNQLSLRPIQTTEETPLILCNKQLESITCDWKCSSMKLKHFGNIPNVYADGQTAAYNLKNSYVRKRNLEHMSQTIHLINLAVGTINQYVMSQLIEVSEKVNQTSQLTQSLENQFRMINAFVESCQSLLYTLRVCHHQQEVNTMSMEYQILVDEMKKYYQCTFDEYTKLKNTLNLLLPPVHQLTDLRVINQSLILHWDELTQSIPDAENMNEFLKTGSKLMSQMDLSYDILKAEVNNTDVNIEPESISVAREYYRRMERLKMQASYQSFENLVKNFQTLFETVFKKFSEWYIPAYSASKQPEILMKNMSESHNNLYQLYQKLNTLIPKFRLQLETFTMKLNNFLESYHLKSAAKDYVKDTSGKVLIVPETSFHQFMRNFRKLRNSPGQIHKDLEKHEELLDESLVSLTLTMSQLQIPSSEI